MNERKNAPIPWRFSNKKKICIFLSAFNCRIIFHDDDDDDNYYGQIDRIVEMVE